MCHRGACIAHRILPTLCAELQGRGSDLGNPPLQPEPIAWNFLGRPSKRLRDTAKAGNHVAAAGVAQILGGLHLLDDVGKHRRASGNESKVELVRVLTGHRAAPLWATVVSGGQGGTGWSIREKHSMESQKITEATSSRIQHKTLI